MNIAFVSKSFPLHPETSASGICKRMGMFIQALKALGRLDMLFFVESDLAINSSFVAETEYRLSKEWDTQITLTLCNLASLNQAKGRWDEYVKSALNIANQAPFEQTAQKEQIEAVHRILSKKPDVLFVHRLACMIPVMLSGAHHPAIYFDMDDIEHVAFKRSIKHPPWWPGKRLYYLRLPVLKLWERRAIRSSHTTFVCSEKDKRYLSKVYGSRNVAVIPNAIDIPKANTPPGKANFLFLGAMSYNPNAVAADYLIKKIWPGIVSAWPSAKLFIAGAKPERIACFTENHPGVEFLGFINDLEKLYRDVAVVCCPILSGGGTRIKILEAAAHGKPVVSTTIGAEGINFQDGKEILLRDDPRSFAEACIHLLKEEKIAAKIGQAARIAVSREYDRNTVVNSIRMCLTNTV